MAASRRLGLTLRNFLAHRKLFQTETCIRLSSTTVDVDDKNEEEEEKKLRDISRLTNSQRRKQHGQTPEIKHNFQKSVRYQRKLYGRLGAASGIDPRVSWTGRQKALELAQLYREWEPSLEERLAKVKADKEEFQKKTEMREKKIIENMAKMDQMIADYRQRQVQKETDALKKEEKKRMILEDAREYFGYYVDPRDPKFQAMLEEKELQEKALAKKQKKEKRLEKLAARLKYLAEEGDK